MASAEPEPRNPFYLALLAVSLLFVITVFAVALVPVLEKKAAEAGTPPPASEFRDFLRADGWQLVLYELAALIVLSLLCMGLDRLRRKRQERAAAGKGDMGPD